MKKIIILLMVLSLMGNVNALNLDFTDDSIGCPIANWIPWYISNCGTDINDWNISSSALCGDGDNCLYSLGNTTTEICGSGYCGSEIRTASFLLNPNVTQFRVRHNANSTNSWVSVYQSGGVPFTINQLSHSGSGGWITHSKSLAYSGEGIIATVVIGAYNSPLGFHAIESIEFLDILGNPVNPVYIPELPNKKFYGNITDYDSGDGIAYADLTLCKIGGSNFCPTCGGLNLSHCTDIEFGYTNSSGGYEVNVTSGLYEIYVAESTHGLTYVIEDIYTNEEELNIELANYTLGFTISNADNYSEKLENVNIYISRFDNVSDSGHTDSNGIYKSQIYYADVDDFPITYYIDLYKYGYFSFENIPIQYDYTCYQNSGESTVCLMNDWVMDSGTSVDKYVKITVRDYYDYETRIENATVRVYDESNTTLVTPLQLTNSYGEVELGLGEGIYNIKVSKTGYTTEWFTKEVDSDYNYWDLLLVGNLSNLPLVNITVNSVYSNGSVYIYQDYEIECEYPDGHGLRASRYTKSNGVDWFEVPRYSTCVIYAENTQCETNCYYVFASNTTIIFNVSDILTYHFKMFDVSTGQRITDGQYKFYYCNDTCDDCNEYINTLPETASYYGVENDFDSGRCVLAAAYSYGYITSYLGFIVDGQDTLIDFLMYRNDTVCYIDVLVDVVDNKYPCNFNSTILSFNVEREECNNTGCVLTWWDTYQKVCTQQMMANTKGGFLLPSMENLNDKSLSLESSIDLSTTCVAPIPVVCDNTYKFYIESPYWTSGIKKLNIENSGSVWIDLTLKSGYSICIGGIGGNYSGSDVMEEITNEFMEDYVTTLFRLGIIVIVFFLLSGMIQLMPKKQLE